MSYYGLNLNIEFVDVAGAAYTLTEADNGKIIRFNTAAACTLTLPEQATASLPEGFNAQFRNAHAAPGQITLATEGTDTLSGAGTVTNDSSKLNGVYLETAGTPNAWVAVGDFA
ncbi:MAG: hypothetical protein K0S46_2198 [Moraxellaceae bacterium]|jgi:hypothetical protein|nr:hypothetical protein [Moraxellaceae bacterium]